VQGRRSIALLGLLFYWAGPAQAGLYSHIERFDRGLSPDYRQFRETLIRLWALNKLNTEGYAPTTDLEKRYFAVKKDSEQGIPDALTAGERLDLGAALIRLQKLEEAIQVLRPGAIQDRGNFLLLSNLATAYHLAGQEVQALDAMQLALTAWPTDWTQLRKEQQLLLSLQMGWDGKQFAWYRNVERYYQKLLRLRLSQSRPGPGFSGQPAGEELDNLFGIRFVGDSGEYEAGKLAADQRMKLPKDALQIVQQLLVWLPNDPRLYWLLGELYNAQGDPQTALEIFDNLVTSRGERSRELRQHRRILQAHPAATPNPTGTDLISSRPGPKKDKKDNENPNSAWAPNPWQIFGVGFLAGGLVALLGLWQVRELRRRRRRRTV
jgi:tetratricopeptide (TPR) repeat protein